MPSMRRLIILGSLALVAGIIIMFPARVAYHWFAPPGVGISGITGSVWNGKARDIVVAGVYVRDLEWRFRPFSLFTGKFGYAISATPGIGSLSSNVAAGLGGTLYVTDLQSDMSLSVLAAAVGVPGLQGRAQADFAALTVSDGILVEAQGVLNASGIVVPIVTQGGIGGYKAEFTSDDSEVVASIEDTDGVVDIAGSLRLSRDRRYVFQGLVAPKETTPQRLAQQMQTFLGSADDRGRYELRLEGQL